MLLLWMFLSSFFVYIYLNFISIYFYFPHSEGPSFYLFILLPVFCHFYCFNKYCFNDYYYFSSFALVCVSSKVK